MIEDIDIFIVENLNPHPNHIGEKKKVGKKKKGEEEKKEVLYKVSIIKGGKPELYNFVKDINDLIGQIKKWSLLIKIDEEMESFITKEWNSIIKSKEVL